MGNFEGTRRQRLEWIESHITLWQANAVAIGLTVLQTTSLKNQVTANRTDFNNAEAARNAAKAATLAFYNTGNSMGDTTRNYIAVIKGFAESTNNPNVYVLANVEPPAPPGVIPAPLTPTDFTGSVSTSGDAVLRWKATPSGRSSGVFFLVERKRVGAGETAWTSLGGTAEKIFIDPDPQLATGSVLYHVKAVRGDEESAWTNELGFTIVEGGGGGGGFQTVGFVNGVATPQSQAA